MLNIMWMRNWKLRYLTYKELKPKRDCILVRRHMRYLTYKELKPLFMLIFIG